MKETVRKYIQANRILTGQGPVLAGVSGGADSVALLLVLQELEYEVRALHCNFHLRGEESERDERFVTNLCRSRNIPLTIQHFDTRGYASRNSISIEMAARDLRYKWFYEMLQKTKAQCIAVAHHQNDQAETLLLNLIRGTGIRGLAGMYPLRNRIARPLLCVSREEIIAYLNQRNQDYVTDSTNLQREAIRNRIRLDILPLMEEINPNIIRTLADTCRYMEASLPFYQRGIEEEVRKVTDGETSVDIRRLQESGHAGVLIYEWLKDKEFTQSQLREMTESLNGTPGKIWESGSYRVLKDRNNLIIQNRNMQPEDIQVIQEQVEGIVETGPSIAYFDQDKLTAPITYRKASKGDWFIPFGMKGKKLISDYLTDVKATRFEKENQLLALCGEDIIWVVGRRSDNRYRVDKNTRRIVRLKIKNKRG